MRSGSDGRHGAQRARAPRAHVARFDRSAHFAADTREWPQARRNCRSASADIRSGQGPEVAGTEKNDRTRQKAVTTMTTETTDSPKERMDCARVAREEVLEAYLLGRLS